MIRFEHVSKAYEKGRRVVDDLNFEIEEGELVCLIGPSGCGKTTTLKMINRLEELSEGKIFISGNDIATIEPYKLRRQIGYVIQQIGLFPHLTIEENISLVPKLLGWSREESNRRVDELLPLVGLDPRTYRKRYPRQLSGGQQQRVGVLRALAGNQNIILMDEPFAALDPIVRETMQEEIRQLQRTLRKTIVFVTHDINEALKIATRIIIMNDGIIVQSGSPVEALKNPANQFVQDFLGKKRLLGVASLPAGDIVERRIITAQETSGMDGVEYKFKQAMSRGIQYVVITGRMRQMVGVINENALTDGRLQTFPAKVVSTDILLIEVMEHMITEQVDYLIVVNNEGQIEGVISRYSLIEIFETFNNYEVSLIEEGTL